MTVLGIDLSLTCTGLAVARYGTIVETATIKTQALAEPDLGAICRRLLTILDGVQQAERRCTPVLAVIEAPSLGSRYGAAHDRSGLWWLVVNELIGQGVPVAQVAPKARAKYGTGNGNSDKAEVHAAVKATYGRPDLPIKTNDEADAVLLAAMGARHLGQPVEAVTEGQLAAMEKVQWP